MRSFFCVELDSDAKEALSKASKTLKVTKARVGWVRPPLLHVTLKFLGRIDPDQVLELSALSKALREQCSPFELNLDRWGVFPNPERPRVIWVGSHSPPTELIKLQFRLDQGLEALGFVPEKHYVPHVTLGRVRERDPNLLRALGQRVTAATPPTLHVPVRRFTLMQSVLGSGGPSYTPLFSEQLGR